MTPQPTTALLSLFVYLTLSWTIYPQTSAIHFTSGPLVGTALLSVGLWTYMPGVVSRRDPALKLQAARVRLRHDVVNPEGTK